MTMVFTSASSNVIVMTVDSAVTLDFEDSHREYDTGRKLYAYPGVGCVGTWGARDGNQIGLFLCEQAISPSKHSVGDLADLVYQYLTEEYQPSDYNLSEVGYHVAGFDREGHAHLYHVFWGFDRPKPEQQTIPKYERYDHTPPTEDAVVFLYNGRNDLADVMVRTLLDQWRQGNVTKFDGTPMGLVRFGDFMVRFAGELTPEVGPPFLTSVISRDNRVQMIKNGGFCRLDPDSVSLKL
jgi:hypothetical protein